MTELAEQPEAEFLYKVVLIGDRGVGKTSLLLRFVDDSWSESYINTIGVDFKVRTLDIDGKAIKLQIWDLPFEEHRPSSLGARISRFFRNMRGVFIVCDITDKGSFESAKNWLDEVDRYRREEAVIFVVGNKSDLDTRREVSTKDGRSFAESLGAFFLETSAKTGDNVSELFAVMAREIHVRSILEKQRRSAPAAVPQKQKRRKKCFCWC